MTVAKQPSQLIQWSRLTGISRQAISTWGKDAGLEQDYKHCYEYEQMRECIASHPGIAKTLERKRLSSPKLRGLSYEDFCEITAHKDRDKRTMETLRRIASRNKEAMKALAEKPAKLPSPPSEIKEAPIEDPARLDADDGEKIGPGILYKMPDGSIDAIDWTDSDCTDPDTGEMDVDKREKKYRGFRQKLAAARDRSELVKREYALAFMNASYMKILTAINTFPDRTASKILALCDSELSPTDKATEIRKCLEASADEMIRSVSSEMTDTGDRLDATVKALIDRKGGNRL